jgi:hypothetical protein
MMAWKLGGIILDSSSAGSAAADAAVLGLTLLADVRNVSEAQILKECM